MDVSSDRFFGLHFGDRSDDQGNHLVSASSLSQALEGLQRVVHLLAMMKLGREVRSRARVTREIEGQFLLVCQPPAEGSYFQSTFIAESHVLSAPVTQLQLFDSSTLDEVGRTARGVFEALQSGNERDFAELVPDSAYRPLVLSSVQQMFVNARGRHSLTIEDLRGRKLLDQGRALEVANEWSRSQEYSPETLAIVTGRLVKIDFSERKMHLQMPDTKRLVPCTYDESVEEIILRSPRDLIQVVGTIELNDDGQPVRITEVEEVFIVDESDIDLLDVLDGTDLKSKSLNEVRIKVGLSEDKQTFLAEFAPLGIDVAAHTRADLLSLLRAELQFLWKNYAEEDDQLLAPSGQRLKASVLGMFERVR